MTADDRLKQALGLGADAPPTVDYGFLARVAGRIEQRRLMARLLVLGLWTVTTVVIGWVLAPMLARSGAAISPAVKPVAMALVLVGAAWLTGQTDLQRLFIRARRAVWPGRG